MASFTVVRKIGAAGGLPYATLALWIADAPTDYTTCLQFAAGTFTTTTFVQNEVLTFAGSGALGYFLDSDSTAPGNGTYLRFKVLSGTPAAGDIVSGVSGAVCTLSGTATFTGCIWQGQINAASDSFTVAGNVLSFPSAISSATAYPELTTATGASFRDNVNAQTNALRFNASNGCAITGTSTGSTITIATNFTRISNLQVAQTGTYSGALQVSSGVDSVSISNCIFEAGGAAYAINIGTSTNGVYKNSLIVQRGSAKAGVIRCTGGTGQNKFYNCTIIVPNDLTAATNCIGSSGASTDIATFNCAIFGVSAMNASGSVAHTTGYSNLTGTGLTQVTYAASMFGDGTTSITDATRDFRTRAAGAITAVVTVNANTLNDIVGTLRPVGANASDAGAWQLVTAAAANTKRFFAAIAA